MLLRLSEKHGVNPAIPLCFLCGKEKNVVLLAGRLLNDEEAPRNVVWDYEPCDECKAYMERGIILISVKDGETGDNPHRTGGWCVVREEALRKFITPENHPIFKKRMAFLEDTTWDKLGLPKEEKI